MNGFANPGFALLSSFSKQNLTLSTSIYPPAIRAGEQMVLEPERNRTDGAFDSVGIDFDATISAHERIAD